MRTLTPSFAVVLATVVAASLAEGQPTSRFHPTSAEKPMHYTVLFSPFFYLDLGRRGASAGDEIISHDRLFTANGKPAGHDATVCTVTDPKRPEANCVVSFTLSGGTITAQFLNTPPPRKLAAITGGTGRYSAAAGEVRIIESSTSRGGTATFTLTAQPNGVASLSTR
ncbi:MAG: hypothetical protein M3018_03865 [Actinomycetota bacterium]|nr:hypothetical protein [Actinomycetota bacterium]